MPFYVRTKSGFELVCAAINFAPDRNGFVRLTQVHRLMYPPGMYAPKATSLLKKRGPADELYLSLSSIEFYTDKIDIDVSAKQFHEK